MQGVHAVSHLCLHNVFKPVQELTGRSFRHSSSGLPLLNLNTAFSAFLASGPAPEVFVKILGRGQGGPPGGYHGGIQRAPELNFMEPREISIVKHAIRGAKVSQFTPLL